MSAKWSVEFLSGADADLSRLDGAIQERIVEKLEWLAQNFESMIPSVLTGEFREFYKLRVGDWRVFYRADRARRRIIVSYVDRRDKVYKK